MYGTGQHTYLGKTAHLVQETHTVSHFQRAVLKIGDYLILLAVALVVVILAVAIFRGDPMTTTLQFALVLTVAAIPVAMPTVLSVTMAVLPTGVLLRRESRFCGCFIRPSTNMKPAVPPAVPYRDMRSWQHDGMKLSEQCRRHQKVSPQTMRRWRLC